MNLEFSKGGRYIFMVFTALPASPPLKTHTKFPGIQWLGYEFGIFKGGQVHFHGIYSTSSVSPLKNHTRVPDIQWLGCGFGIFKGGQVHFHGIYSASSLSPLKNPHKVSRYTMTWLWIWNDSVIVYHYHVWLQPCVFLSKIHQSSFLEYSYFHPPLRHFEWSWKDVGGGGNMEYS